MEGFSPDARRIARRIAIPDNGLVQNRTILPLWASLLA
jgi:hypothetical protein